MKKPVSLVLSSGGARGLAHIGAIEELENHSYEIKSIAGTSMGALIGGLYATGSLEKYKEWVSNLDKMDVFKLVDFTFSLSGLIKGDRVMHEMQKMIPDINIEELPISFVAIATDIINQKEVVFENGSLYDAIRSSIAIPTLLTPFEKEDLQLVDGGVLNPIPVNRVKRADNDILVVVNVNALVPAYKPILTDTGQRKNNLYSKNISLFNKKLNEIIPKTKHEKLKYFNLITQTISLMLNQISLMTLEKYPPDILINVSKSSCGIYDFYKAKEMIEVGKRATKETIESIK